VGLGGPLGGVSADYAAFRQLARPVIQVPERLIALRIEQAGQRLERVPDTADIGDRIGLAQVVAPAVPPVGKLGRRGGQQEGRLR
jgi:hypothetical protein